jgi:hypothetical protein
MDNAVELFSEEVIAVMKNFGERMTVAEMIGCLENLKFMMLFNGAKED